MLCADTVGQFEVIAAGAVCDVARCWDSVEGCGDAKTFFDFNGLMDYVGSFWSASESFGQGATGAVVVDENEEVCVSESGIPKLKADEVWQELGLENELGLACAMRPGLAESGRDLGTPCSIEFHCSYRLKLK